MRYFRLTAYKVQRLAVYRGSMLGQICGFYSLRANASAASPRIRRWLVAETYPVWAPVESPSEFGMPCPGSRPIETVTVQPSSKILNWAMIYRRLRKVPHGEVGRHCSLGPEAG